MKINRLFEIVYLLLDKGRVTAKELAERFEVSTRTIYRDVEDLSAAGIPIYMSKGKNGGISLLPDYVLNKTLLTEEEKIKILSALQSLNALDELSVDDTLSKVSAFFGDKNQGFYEIDFDDWGSLIKDQFEKSKQAILSKKLLSFDYLSSLNKHSKRIVEPYKLWFKEKNWYLKAYCLKKKEVRFFRFSRMRNVTIEDVQFTPKNIDLGICPDNQYIRSTTKILMRVEKEATYRILDEFSEQDIVENQDGSVIVTMNFPEDEWVYGYILSFGSFATVIEPLSIKKIIRQKLEDSLKNYS
ncbi:MAG: helix-turn-helix transcriptional regulator [Anaerovoracaceae bacterium]|jgi:predicted DNA-binding transcriptional regulator YafY